MKIPEHIDALQREGRLLSAAAGRTDLDTPLPTCPDWRMRDRVRHVGGVHRWAAGYVGDRRTKAWDVDMLLWNRRSDADISVGGDRDLLAQWRDGVRIRWK